MISRRTFVPIVLALVVCAGSPALAQATDIVPLAPHRAGYELSLHSTRGKSVSTATGRIGLEFTGTACDGYATTFRQLTQIGDGEGQNQTSEMRVTSFETGEGKALDFRSEKRTNGNRSQTTDGRAERAGDGGVSIRIKEPKPIALDIDGDVVFPTEHMARLIAAAKRDERIVGVKVYDGSDTGEKVYDTTALIGTEVPAGGRQVEDAAQKAGLAAMRRWPVAISYFEPGTGERTPVYVLSFDMFENGVSGALKLDFGEFALKGEMTRLEMLKPADCAKR
ncbi:MAG: cell envelope integrity EipB family protein [Beijerinckiaceae bacterium]